MAGRKLRRVELGDQGATGTRWRGKPRKERYTYLRDEVDGGRRGGLGESLLVALQLR